MKKASRICSPRNDPKRNNSLIEPLSSDIPPSNVNFKYQQIRVHITHSLSLSKSVRKKSIRSHNARNCIAIKTEVSSIGYSIPTLLITNACHITNKVTELCGVVAKNNPSFVLITESWLDSSIPDSGVAIGDSYNIYRKDRPTPGGGILAYISNNIPTTRLRDLEENSKEVIWLLLKCAKIPRPFSSILVVGVYYPPGQSAEAEKDMLLFLTNGIDSVLRDRPSIGLIITGDFNQINLSPLCRRFSLRKVVKAPTRGRNTLDQILTNMFDLYNDVKHLPP